MRNLIFISLFILPFTFCGQKNGELVGVGYKQKPPKNFAYIPEGTYITKNDTLNLSAFWMSNEITNEEFNLFLTDLKENPKDTIFDVDFSKFIKTRKREDIIFHKYIHKDVLKNTENNSLQITEDLSLSDYLKNRKYKKYPVLGVSYETARMYCLWLTQKENVENEKEGLPPVMDYRLPTEAEWEYAADTPSKSINENNYPLRKSTKGKKNTLGLKNMYGNVSEWVLKNKYSDQPYVKGAAWKALNPQMTGFRIVKPVPPPLEFY